MRTATSIAPAKNSPRPKPIISSPDRVAASITKGVLRRQYVVGQRLVESDLTTQLGVSRSTVREALKILLSGAVGMAAKRFVRSVLLGAIWLGIPLPRKG